MAQRQKRTKRRNGITGFLPRFGSNRHIKRLGFWAKRLGVFGGIVIFVLWIGAWLWLSGSFEKTADAIGERLVRQSAQAGLKIDKILVQGRNNIKADHLLQISGLNVGDPILVVDPKSIRQKIEELRWVKDARIQIRYPDTVYLNITERAPLALWHYKKDIWVIDKHGVKLTENDLSRFSDLPIVSGKSANEHAAKFLNLLAAEPLLEDRLGAAALIGERRWDLKLNNGIVIHLPGRDSGLSLRRLVKAHEKTGLLDKDIVSVDARHDDRLIIKTKPGAVQTLRSRTDGTKAGDAKTEKSQDNTKSSDGQSI